MMIVRTAILIGVVLLVLAPASRAQTCKAKCSAGEEMDKRGCCVKKPTPPTCEAGKTTSEDTAGHCCWAGQVWDDGRCRGKPTGCPEGYEIDAKTESCAAVSCPAGQELANDKLHCCWPGQAWSNSRAPGRCVGAPARCPDGYRVDADGETCALLPCPAGAVRATDGVRCEQPAAPTGCTPLEQADIVKGMGAVPGRVRACNAKYKVPGTVTVRVEVMPDGSVGRASVGGVFAGTPTGSCVERVVMGARFRASCGRTIFRYPYVFR